MKEYLSVNRVEFDCAGTIVVADPCYIDEDDAEIMDKLEVDAALPIFPSGFNGRGYLAKALPGLWLAEVRTHISEEGWGNRVAAIQAYHRETMYGSDKFPPFREVAAAGVDSGQMFVGDANSLPLNYQDLMDKKFHKNDDRTLFDWLCGFGEGAVSTTGYGDGLYYVRVARKDDLAVGVEVIFIEDPVCDCGHPYGFHIYRFEQEINGIDYTYVECSTCQDIHSAEWWADRGF